jgi:3'-5' exoribonuclease
MSEKRTRTPIAEWKPGDQVAAYVNLIRKRRVPYVGGEYWEATARDQTGAILVADFDSYLRSVPEGFSAVSGAVRTYEENLQLVLEQCRPVEPADPDRGFDPRLLIPRSPVDGSEILRILSEARGRLKSDAAARCWNSAMERFGDRFLRWPAAARHHHAYRGGLATHTCAMLKSGMALAGAYDLDRDVLLLGILMHDMGKLEELAETPGGWRTMDGHAVGHVVRSWAAWGMVINDAQAPKPLADHVDHLILSHHGQLGYGSPVLPLTPEAHMLHQLDMIDSRLAMVREATEVNPEKIVDAGPLGKALGRWPGAGGER